MVALALFFAWLGVILTLGFIWDTTCEWRIARWWDLNIETRRHK